MEWVLNSYQTCQDWDVDTIIAMCRRTGHEGVEFLMDFDQAHGVEDDADPDYVQGVVDRVEEAGLKVASLTSCAVFHDVDEEKRTRNLAKAERTVDLAGRVGCSHVRVLGDRIQDPSDPDATIGRVVEGLQELGARAEPLGVTVSLEMHGDFTDPKRARAVMERVGRSNVGLVFNCQWQSPRGDWSLPADAPSIRPIYDLTREYYTSIHTHDMEDPKQTRFYLELFGLLRSDGFSGFVSNECSYRGAEPEKVLSLYTAFFKAATRPS